MNYIIVVIGFIALCVVWGVFQLWLGRQADGTPVDSDTRECAGCGGVEQARDHARGPTRQ